MSKAISMEPRREPRGQNGSPPQAETDARLESLLARLIEQVNARAASPDGPSTRRLSTHPLLLAAWGMAIGATLAGAAAWAWRSGAGSGTAQEPSAPPRPLRDLTAGPPGLQVIPAAPAISSWAPSDWQPAVEVRHLPRPVIPAQPPDYEDLQLVNGYLTL